MTDTSPGMDPPYLPDDETTLSDVSAANPEGLAVLRHVAQAVGLPFDSTKVARALRQAAQDIPPTVPRAARLRVSQAAEAAGLLFLTRQLSVREALACVEPDAPLSIFAVTPAGTARWYILAEARAGHGRLARLESGDPKDWLDADEIARTLGAVDADAVVEWLIAQPAAPLADASVYSGVRYYEDDEHHGPSPLSRLLGLLRPEAREIWMVVVYAIGVGVLSLAVPITAMAVVNTTALATRITALRLQRPAETPGCPACSQIVPAAAQSWAGPLPARPAPPIASAPRPVPSPVPAEPHSSRRRLVVRRPIP